MHELDKSIEKMQLRLLSEKTLDSRRDLTFYLAWAETYRGHFKLNSKEYGKALAIYKEALRVDPSNMGARVSLTVCYTRQSEFELALRQLEKAIHTFNGQHKKVEPHYDQGLWHWHRNEVSSEYEQSAGLFQLCGFVLAYLRISDLSGGAKELLERDIVNLVETIPDRSQEELLEMLARKGGTSPGAMGLLAAGPYRRPASPLDLLSEGFCLPLLPLQSIEPAA
jgi:tetratricopeptide (TPR) repeat protein